MSGPGRGQARGANRRGAARLSAVQALYQMDIGGATLDDVIAEFESLRLGRELDGVQYLEADAAFFRGIVSGVVANQRRLDPLIHEALAEGWPLVRIDATLRAILRCGALELTERRDIPARVVISEYVDVAKAFFDDDGPKVVNGVLDRLARSARAAEFVAED